MLDVNWNPSRRDLRLFGAVWLPLFAAIAGTTVLHRTGSFPIALTIWTLGAVSGVVGLASPLGLKWLFVGWMVLAYPIGWVVSLVFLGVTYFGLFTVAGGIMRLVRYDPLARRRHAAAQTYWSRKDDTAPPATYFRQS